MNGDHEIASSLIGGVSCDVDFVDETFAGEDSKHANCDRSNYIQVKRCVPPTQESATATGGCRDIRG